MKDFTSQQKEIVARKLGYDGPMQGFDEFLASSPALEAKYAAISGKFTERMAKGGLIKLRKFAQGGDVLKFAAGGFTQAQINQALREELAARPDTDPAALAAYAKSQYGLSDSQISTAYSSLLPTKVATGTTGGNVTGGGDVTFSDVGGTPQAAAASKIAPAQVAYNATQDIAVGDRAGAAKTVEATTPATTSLAAMPTKLTAEQVTASTASPEMGTLLAGFTPAQGTVSEAATVKPAVAGLTALAGAADRAEQIAAPVTVKAPEARVMTEAETVAGPTVDMTKVATELAKAEAAQGVVTEDMTVQGQLAKLTANFDAKNPPAWAAGALRTVTAEMAARGLGASSLAGAALVQAAMEKALPIASADAAIYQQMATQNLSNRQQIAVLTAQQRATFLGQEFDQSFQTRVINAARVADIANMNFNANQQVALENSRLAQSVDLANLNSRQAAFMAELAQTATLETATLNNRQQAAVANAQAALQMDLTNLSYEQQATVLRTQITAQALLSDTAAENAAKQFNATSVNQTNQFFASLTSQVGQFNAAQTNAMEQFRVDQANSIKKFNADVQNQREQFNAQQRLVIDQSNAQWQREIATINTGAINTINLSNAQLAQQMTLTEYNNEIQMYRDSVTHAWQSSENDANRSTTLAAAELAKSAQLAIADATTAAANARALGELTASFVGKTSFSDIVKVGKEAVDFIFG